MDHGITMFSTDLAMHPAELAVECEARGFSSLYVPEHTHIPIARTTPPPSGADQLPQEYSRTLDPFVALAWAASRTERIRVGTGVCLVAQHDPIALAKAVATIDHLSGGRFTFGVGFGWNREEMADHGIRYGERREVVRERVLAMQALWSDEPTPFAGQHVQVSESWAWPKPVQRPRPPVLIGGGAGPVMFGHVCEWADGWIPIGGAGLTEALPRLRGQWADAGRDPAQLQVVPFGSEPDPGKLEHFHSLGLSEVVFRVPSASREEVLPLLDHYAGLLSH